MTNPLRRLVRTTGMTATIHPPAEGHDAADPVARPDHRSASLSSIAGLTSAAIALAAGHLAGGLTIEGVSPVVAVGERVIHAVPVSVERFAIETFGHNDKLALVIGITATVLVLGAAVGSLAGRRPLVVPVAFGGFALLGAVASLDGRRPLVIGLMPSLVAALAGIISFAVLRRLQPRPIGDTVDGSRRAFLAAAAGGAVLALGLRSVGSALRQRFSAAASRAAVLLPRPRTPLPTLPASTLTPGIAPFITPNADFYRVDTALLVPQVPAETWELRITGMVDRPFRLTFDELLGRNLVEADITLTCVSNTVGGKLVGNARWLGLPLAELLDEAGVQVGADQIVGRSVDGYTCGFPVSAAYDRMALVAVGMNGEPLPIEHGFPARLITPGLYGYVSATKWLTEIELTTFDAFDQYWVPRGWDALAPIKTMSRIDTPRSLARITPGPTAIGGVAWAQTRGISKVEVRVDQGDWLEADLGEAPGADTWRQWSIPWQATPGRHTLSARATDGSGELQTDVRAEIFPNGASGWHTLLVTVDDA
jgi:DMSO/TMAO reductase YedYZ molybdopterin-dependent catalytic subunit